MCLSEVNCSKVNKRKIIYRARDASDASRGLFLSSFEFCGSGRTYLSERNC
jgi:hypothetical protein